MLCLLHVLFRDGSFAIACCFAEVKVSCLACQHAALNDMTTDCDDREHSAGMLGRPCGCIALHDMQTDSSILEAL